MTWPVVNIEKNMPHFEKLASMIGKKCGNVGMGPRRGVVPRRLLGRLRLPACLPWARFGGGGGAVLAWRFAARGARYTGGAPAAVGRGAGWRCRLGCARCVGGRVGVAALGGVCCFVLLN
jgi:hypothetical protein